MSYNHLGDGFLYGEGAGFTPMVPTNGAADKSVDDSVDRVFFGSLTNVDALNYLENGTYETRTAEDGGREDMFVDCPDEIENSESEQKSEEKENLQDNGFQDSGINVRHWMTVRL